MKKINLLVFVVAMGLFIGNAQAELRTIKPYHEKLADDEVGEVTLMNARFTVLLEVGLIHMLIVSDTFAGQERSYEDFRKLAIRVQGKNYPLPEGLKDRKSGGYVMVAFTSTKRDEIFGYRTMVQGTIVEPQSFNEFLLKTADGDTLHVIAADQLCYDTAFVPRNFSMMKDFGGEFDLIVGINGKIAILLLPPPLKQR